MLLYVVHHAVQAPLRPDIRLPAMVQAAQAFVVPQVCKHRLHGADALGVQLPASRGIGGLAYAFAGGLRLRTQGAKSALLAAPKRSDRISQWLLQLRDRVGWLKALVALANKNARILWAVLTREIDFDPEHVPPAPQCKLPALKEPQPA